MSQFCTNSLHSQEKWTVALVEEHYSLCNYNLCSGRQKELHHITKYNRALKQKKKDFLSSKEREFFLLVSIYSTLFSLQLQYCISIKMEKKDCAFFQKRGELREFCYQYVILTRYFINLGCFFLNQSRITQNFLLFFFSSEVLDKVTRQTTLIDNNIGLEFIEIAI